MLYIHYPVEHCSFIRLLSSVLLSCHYSFCYKIYHLSSSPAMEIYVKIYNDYNCVSENFS